MASLDASMEQLNTAWKILHKRWGDTTPLWNDSVSQGFEKNCMAVFEGQTQATLKEMQYLAQVVGEAQRRVH